VLTGNIPRCVATCTSGALSFREIAEASAVNIFMMFDPGHTLAERILAEQFGY